MMDEKDLMARCGKKTSFEVPEGYFEQFHDRLMNNLPEPEAMRTAPAAPVSLMTRVRPWLYMAALFVSTIFVVQGLMYVQETRFPSENTATAEELYTEEADHFMSSSLYNEYALYSYLTNENE
ncbi:MAG: hypothetical protein IJA98_04685 [Bacteroidaceae bacterium]|nr:hypothetical protein [Bacteroidaceae bacterium]MBQ3238350.1 hypothetical protein [Bacteroidaceae bacterium]MBQ7967220.1 hypothetical protein [Bacteroidaceae bacterium]MBR3983898.1 hypothetical protein [Bacteroidaceae bacterium]MBR4040751.1 hypothetical protein [Bacteroidaceae bacterium]